MGRRADRGVRGDRLPDLLIALIVLVVRGMRTTARDTAAPALRVLEERYALGEITREEFLERRAVLDRNGPDPAQSAPR
jgi:Short C-terminal domain